MRVVIDTNVFVSSFFGGNPRKVLALWMAEKVVLCLSGEILDEYVKVLRRMGLEDEDELAELLSFLARGFNSVFAARTPKLNVLAGDPDDNKFIECAVALKAEVIVTGDKEFGALGSYGNIKILAPAPFLKYFSSHMG